jgi:hypothetical protein
MIQFGDSEPAPDPEHCFKLVLRRVVDPDPYWESGSRGKKTKKFQWKKCKILPLKSYKIALTTFSKKFR